MKRLRRRLAREEGWALVTALSLMLIMGGVGLSTMAFVDTQTKQSKVERTRETAFNLAEAALNAQIFALTHDWPGKVAGNAYPSCDSSTGGPHCPSAATLASTFTSQDAASGASWKSDVRDNSTGANCKADTTAGSYYDDARFSTVYRYDCNDDKKVWVRAQATAGGKTRTLVALVRVEQQREDIPHDVIIAGSWNITNNGKHGGRKIVDGSSSAQPAPIVVRCTPQPGETTPCLGHPMGGGTDWQAAFNALKADLQQQVNSSGYVVGDTSASALSPDALARLKSTAIANGTYYAGCPSSLSGAVVWVDSCSMTSQGDVNSAAAPGILIWNSGVLTFRGNGNFYGLIYHVNSAHSSGTLVDIGGNATIYGAVVIDGNGGINTGSNGNNVVIDDNAFNAVQSYGTAGIIQNTWREIRSTP
jgi:hypothetical protein